MEAKTAMGIFDGYLLCSDFDGTMALRAKVSQENLDAIAYFQKEGGVFCPASGRGVRFFRDYAELFRANGPLITLNGSAVVRYGETPEEDEFLFEGHIPRELAFEYTDAMFEEEGVLCVTLCRRNDHFNFYTEKATRAPAATPREARDGIEGDFRKILVLHDGKHLDAIRAHTEPIYRDRFVFGCSWENGYEAQMIGSDKGSSALRVKEMVGAHTLVTVGDYENDLLMLKAGDVSYAVGNAVDCLKEVADRITVPCSEHAIAAIVADLERDVRAKGK